eukprot:Seg8535.1 transcript_id=Seg8535.1/GoldUCD/mRNA.D3Y31 product="hypothetical protein" protein_id=Seg8535.1/GoldUCD/D3Y31
MKFSILALALIFVHFSCYDARSRHSFSRSDTPSESSDKKESSDKRATTDLAEIYKKSMPAVIGMLSINDTVKLLMDTYLTDKEDDSVWPKAILETKLWFGEEHSRKELGAIERDLKKYRTIISTCIKENTGKELTRCLATLKDALVAGAGDFDWLKEQEIPKNLNFYVPFNLMRLASLQLLKIQQEKDDIEGLKIDESIKNLAKEFSETLKKSTGLACDQRIERISPVDICRVVDVMWQEFHVDCEDRVKRSNEEDEESSGDEEGTESVTGKRFETNSRSDFTGEKEGNLKLSKLGGTQNDFVETMRAKVKDRVTGQYIYNKR